MRVDAHPTIYEEKKLVVRSNDKGLHGPDNELRDGVGCALIGLRVVGLHQSGCQEHSMMVHWQLVAGWDHNGGDGGAVRGGRGSTPARQAG